MMPERARTIGRVQAAKAVTIGLGLAHLIMAGLAGNLGWLGRRPRWWPNLLVATAVMYLCAYVYGRWAGAAILKKARCGLGWNRLRGLDPAECCVSGQLGGVFQEGLAKVGTYENPFVDYLVKPLFWVSVVGFLPASLVGLWFGNSIRRNAKQP